MSHKRRKLASGSLVVEFWASQGLAAWRKRIWKLNGVREVMTMAMATGSEDDGGGHDSSDDVGQW